MAQKIILIADPGIDTAFAVALAMLDSKLDVLALCATAGNVPALQATVNVHTLIAQLDPPRWPRLGGAPPVTYDVDGTRLHGTDGLGNADFPAISLHAPTASDRLLTELVRQSPHDITVVCLGPLTVLAAAFGRDPGIVKIVDRVVCVGGAWREPGNSSALAEFHIYCDPTSARKVLQSGANITLIPLDVTRKLVFSPSDLLELLYGIEGFHMKDVLANAALALPKSLTLHPYFVDVETQGELTRGVTVVDARPNSKAQPNVQLATGVDVLAVRDYIFETLRRAEDTSI